ncbi:hypothetical protein [Lewinella sp. 4G2]|uniref:hypothetical protein n=1 Tax=Lewinella sp. 4G2 TaxID=1803372 RepID=UPI0018D34FAE|nr:hypothetical protein [Lewinella sp. 4G2]
MLALAILVAPSLYGQTQTQVRALNGTNFVSASALAANETKLASLLPTDDVRITFATNYISIKDRYNTYSNNALLDFAEIPYGQIEPLNQQEINDALNNTIAHALNTAVGVTSKTIHVVYATLVSPNRQGQGEVTVRKYFSIGPDAKSRTKGIVKQIKPAPDANPQWGTPLGDQWLDDYVDEIVNAVNDPTYVVNGSVRYDNEVYYAGDTLFYFHRPDELLTGSVSSSETIELLINSNYQVSRVGWSETAANTGIQPLLGNGAATSALTNLTLDASQFGSEVWLTANYGDETGDFIFIPVNLRMELLNTDVVQESVPPDNVVTLTNNGMPFAGYSGFDLKITAYKPGNGGALNSYHFDQTYTNGQSPVASIGYGGVCENIKYEGKLYRGSRQAINRRSFTQRVKCPFDLEELRLVGMSIDGNTRLDDRAGFTFKDRVGDAFDLSNDTLYVVSDSDTLDRSVTVRMNYFGDNPTPDEFWGELNSRPGDQGAEGIWDFGSPNMAGLSISEQNYHHSNDFTLSMTEPAYAADRSRSSTTGSGGYVLNGVSATRPLNHGEVEAKVYPISLTAFDQTATTHLALIRKHKSEEKFEPGLLSALPPNHKFYQEAPVFTTMVTLVTTFQNDIGHLLDNFAIAATKKREIEDMFALKSGITYNYSQLEDPNSRGYKDWRKREYEAKVEFTLPAIPIPTPRIPLWVGEIGAEIVPSGDIFIKSEFQDLKQYNVNNWNRKRTGFAAGYNFYIQLDAGFKMEDQYKDDFTVEAFGSAKVGAGYEYGISFNGGSGQAGSFVTVDFILQPLELSVNLKLAGGNRTGGYNWTVIDATYTYNVWNAKRLNIMTFTLP